MRTVKVTVTREHLERARAEWEKCARPVDECCLVAQAMEGAGLHKVSVGRTRFGCTEGRGVLPDAAERLVALFDRVLDAKIRALLPVSFSVEVPGE